MINKKQSKNKKYLQFIENFKEAYKSKIYIYGIAITSEEKDELINEAKKISDVEDIIASILLVDNLRVQKN